MGSESVPVTTTLLGHSRTAINASSRALDRISTKSTTQPSLTSYFFSLSLFDGAGVIGAFKYSSAPSAYPFSGTSSRRRSRDRERGGREGSETRDGRTMIEIGVVTGRMRFEGSSESCVTTRNPQDLSDLRRAPHIPFLFCRDCGNMLVDMACLWKTRRRIIRMDRSAVYDPLRCCLWYERSANIAHMS